MSHFSLPEIKESASIEKEEQIPAYDVLQQAMAIEVWGYENAPHNPQLCTTLFVTRPLISSIMKLRFVTAAIQASPRRAITGESGAMKRLQMKSRNDLYGFAQRLGISIDDMRTKDMDELMYLSPSLRYLFVKMRALHSQIFPKKDTGNDDIGIPSVS